MPLPTNMHDVTVTAIPVQMYTGKAVTPIPEARFGETPLTFAKDFSVTYKNNEAPGEAIVILHGKGHYTGITDRRFIIE